MVREMYGNDITKFDLRKHMVSPLGLISPRGWS